MKKRSFVYIIFFCFSLHLTALPFLSEENNQKNQKFDGYTQLSSINIEFLQSAIYYPTYKAGLEFEKYIGKHLSVSGILSQSARFGYWINSDVFITNSTLGASIRSYPIHSSLRGFYAGFGTGFDSMFNLGSEKFQEGTQQLFLYVMPEFGLKIYLLKNLMLDLSCNYKFQPVKNEENLPKNYEKFMEKGFHAGVCLKFFWPK